MYVRKTYDSEDPGPVISKRPIRLNRKNLADISVRMRVRVRAQHSASSSPTRDSLACRA